MEEVLKQKTRKRKVWDGVKTTKKEKYISIALSREEKNYIIGQLLEQLLFPQWHLDVAVIYVIIRTRN